jgi:hypothetical protein
MAIGEPNRRKKIRRRFWEKKYLPNAKKYATGNLSLSY